MADVEGLDVDAEGPGGANDFGLLSGLDLGSGLDVFLGGMMGSWVRPSPGSSKPNGALEYKIPPLPTVLVCPPWGISFRHIFNYFGISGISTAPPSWISMLLSKLKKEKCGQII